MKAEKKFCNISSGNLTIFCERKYFSISQDKNKNCFLLIFFFSFFSAPISSLFYTYMRCFASSSSIRPFFIRYYIDLLFWWKKFIMLLFCCTFFVCVFILYIYRLSCLRSQSFHNTSLLTYFAHHHI